MRNHELSVVFNLQVCEQICTSLQIYLYRYIPTYYLQLFFLYCSMLYGLAIFAMITTTICNYVKSTLLVRPNT